MRPSTCSSRTAAPGETLFELDASSARPGGVPHGIEEALTEFARQRAAIDGATDPSRLRLLVAAESAGGLIAAELHAAGIPWDVAEHDRILAESLGPRPSPGSRRRGWWNPPPRCGRPWAILS